MPTEDQACDMLSVYRKFHEIMDKPGFRHIIKYASSIFNAPVIFTDEEYRLVSLYPAKKIGDPVYDSLLETGSLPIDTIVAFQQAYLDEEGIRYEPFFAKDGLVKDMPRIFAEVYDDTHIFGHIGIFINKADVEPWQLEAASILVSVLRIKIKLSKEYTPSLSKDLDTLISTDSSNNAKSIAVSNLNRFFKASGVLVVAPFNQSKAQLAFLAVALNHIQRNFIGTISTIHNNDLVMLVTNENKQTLNNMKTVQELALFLSQYKITCGAVYPVENLYLLPNYYFQSRLAALLKFKTEDNAIEGNQGDIKLIYYNEVTPEPMYLYMSKHPEYSNFISPLLKSIKDYDTKKNTEFFLTLKCYCENLTNINKTAKKLNIHRNTLMYRLNRIEELFSIDLEDYKNIHYLLISFELDKYHT